MNELAMRSDVGSSGCVTGWTRRAGLGIVRLNNCPQPSLRVPATEANRDYLRRLRALEAAAWEMGKDLRQAALSPDEG